MFAKFIDIFQMKFGNPSHREKLAIYEKQLEQLKEKLIISINEKKYENILLILNKKDDIEHNVLLILIDYKLNRADKIRDDFSEKWNFEKILMDNIKESKNAELLNFLKIRNYIFVKGYHIKGVSSNVHRKNF